VVHCPPRKGRNRDTAGGLFANNFVSTTKVHFSLFFFSAPEYLQRVAAKKLRRGADSMWSTRVHEFMREYGRATGRGNSSGGGGGGDADDE